MSAEVPKLTVFRGRTFYDKADTQAVYRSLRLENGATFVLNPGVQLIVEGKLLISRGAKIKYGTREFMEQKGITR